MLLLCCHKTLLKLHIDDVTDRTCERSGKRSGAGRKSGERERSGERTFQKTLERQWSAAVERGAGGSGAESGCHKNRLEG